jgi:hypothetical protein
MHKVDPALTFEFFAKGRKLRGDLSQGPRTANDDLFCRRLTAAERLRELFQI